MDQNQESHQKLKDDLELKYKKQIDQLNDRLKLKNGKLQEKDARIGQIQIELDNKTQIEAKLRKQLAEIQQNQSFSQSQLEKKLQENIS